MAETELVYEYAANPALEILALMEYRGKLADTNNKRNDAKKAIQQRIDLLIKNSP